MLRGKMSQHFPALFIFGLTKQAARDSAEYADRLPDIHVDFQPTALRFLAKHLTWFLPKYLVDLISEIRLFPTRSFKNRSRMIPKQFYILGQICEWFSCSGDGLREQVFSLTLKIMEIKCNLTLLFGMECAQRRRPRAEGLRRRAEISIASAPTTGWQSN